MVGRARSGTGPAQAGSRLLRAAVAATPRRTITGTIALPDADRREHGHRTPGWRVPARAGWVTWSANRDGAIDRHGVAEQVKNRAMLIDGRRKLLVALGRLRPGDAYLDPDS